MSNAIEFGISMGLLRGAKEEARRAEALGYDYLLTGEHLMFYTPVANNLVSLAAAAGATETIKLMSGIVLVPLYPAALLAKQVAMLDVVSGGRFSLGVGVGGEFPKEFEAVGVPVKERGARTDEALQVIDKLLTEKDVHFDGRFTKLNGVSIAPRGIQKPRLPFWVAGRKDVAMRRAARYAEGWLPYMYTPEMLDESMTKIEAFTAEAGRPAGTVQGGLFIFTCVHEDRATALDMANQQLSKQYNQDFSKMVAKYTIAGSPDDCVARLREYIDAGARTIMFSQGCPPEYAEENTRLIAEGILPAFR
ncbi:MAG: LLM class flavin-dependent oxidoreductase [Acidimicrobiales bacterium]|nr:LLM class flavin-dependent oxidoreductase [Acidimicrobiales bacterium]